MTAISDHEPYLGSEYVDSSSVLDNQWTGVGQVHDNSVFKKLAVPPKAGGWLGKLAEFGARVRVRSAERTNNGSHSPCSKRTNAHAP